ncbi:hypothetical protein BTR25_19835 [Bacillus sp. MRMR6]|nr:hypothetical protein BTR25_19835 [Bacillus sp. MRMR6]
MTFAMKNFFYDFSKGKVFIGFMMTFFSDFSKGKGLHHLNEDLFLRFSNGMWSSSSYYENPPIYHEFFSLRRST